MAPFADRKKSHKRFYRGQQDPAVPLTDQMHWPVDLTFPKMVIGFGQIEEALKRLPKSYITHHLPSPHPPIVRTQFKNIQCSKGYFYCGVRQVFSRASSSSCLSPSLLLGVGKTLIARSNPERIGRYLHQLEYLLLEKMV
jgi:hypothetical protein